MTTYAAEFTALERAVADFKQARAERAAWGVSWIMADRQLETLIHHFPDRARSILDAIEQKTRHVLADDDVSNGGPSARSRGDVAAQSPMQESEVT